MNKSIKEIVKDIEALDEQREQIEKEIDVEIRRIINIIMSYREKFEIVRNENKQLDSSWQVSQDNRLTIYVSHGGFVIKIITRKNNYRYSEAGSEKALTIYVNDNGSDYTMKKSDNISCKDTFVMVKEVANKLIEVGNPAIAEILSQVAQDLKESIG